MMTLNKQISLKKCVVCNKEFKTTNKYQKTCGLNCCNLYFNNRTNIKICKRCNKEFVAKGRSVYCSNECKVSKGLGICANCGKEFVKLHNTINCEKCRVNRVRKEKKRNIKRKKYNIKNE